IPRSCLHVVHDGVDPQRMLGGDIVRGRQILAAAADDGPILLCVARLADHKGHRYLLEAMPDVLQGFPRTILALAGDGELQEALRRQADQLTIIRQIRWLGHTAELPHLMAAADLCVMPSHMEGLCSSLIDAMFAHRAIVATTAGGIPDLLGAYSSDDPAV